MAKAKTAVTLGILAALGCQNNGQPPYHEVTIQKSAAVNPTHKFMYGARPTGKPAVKTPEPRKFLVFVNYDAELKDVADNGRYAWQNRKLTSYYFPSGESGEKDIEFFLIQPNQPVNPEDFAVELCEHGLRPATAMELMAFGRQYRYFLSENPVLALGSYFVNWDQQSYSACFYSEADQRFADIRKLDNSLPANLIFAVVPE